MLGTKKRLASLERQVNSYHTAHLRADQRLDRTGAALVQALGDTVNKHESGRYSGVTYTDYYTVTIFNDPSSPTVTLRSENHPELSQSWLLSTSDWADFNDTTLEEMEDWIVGAKTGVPVDYERHAKRAALINEA